MIDIGSNTVHVLVMDAVRDARPTPAVEERSIVRLMDHLLPDGSISPQGITALENAVSKAVKAAERFGTDQMMGLATSAIREATNGPDVLARLEEIAGVPLTVLSGDAESRLTFLAARRWHGWAAGRLLVLDIGGGSFEIAIGMDEVPDYAASVPLGAGRLTHEFLSDDPPSPEQLKALKKHIKATLAPVARELAGHRKPDHVVATSKTFRSLARLAGQLVAVVGPAERRRMSLADLKDWTPRLKKIPEAARTELPGITPERSRQIVAGAMVAERAMKAFGVKSLEICPWALREGAILRRIDQISGNAELGASLLRL